MISETTSTTTRTEEQKNSEPLSFSLVVATIGRSLELEKLFDSLLAQTYKNFDVIVVDQNEAGVLDPVLSRYQGHLVISHIRSEKGLSRARNAGLKIAQGDIVCFPDDDCWYPPELLERVVSRFVLDRNLGGLCGRCATPESEAFARFDTSAGAITRRNVWTRCVSVSLFVRRAVGEAVEGFDKMLGAGAASRNGSGEETDFVLRALAAGVRMEFDPAIFVYHPAPTLQHNDAVMQRAYNYGRGCGHVLRKHSYSLVFVLYLLLRPTGGIALELLKGNWGKTKFHFHVLKGRVAGWFDRK